MTKVKEILNDLGIHKEVINCNKEKLSDELVQSIYDYCNYPSKVLNKFMYKQWKKIFDKLQRATQGSIYIYYLIGGMYMLKKFNEKIAVVECLSGFRLSRLEKFNLFIMFILKLQEGLI